MNKCIYYSGLEPGKEIKLRLFLGQRKDSKKRKLMYHFSAVRTLSSFIHVTLKLGVVIPAACVYRFVGKEATSCALSMTDQNKDDDNSKHPLYVVSSLYVSTKNVSAIILSLDM